MVQSSLKQQSFLIEMDHGLVEVGMDSAIEGNGRARVGKGPYCAGVCQSRMRLLGVAVVIPSAK